MLLCKSTMVDLEEIIPLHRIAFDFQKTTSVVHWPEFESGLIESEILENRQWKLLFEGQITLCIGYNLQQPINLGKNIAP